MAISSLQWRLELVKVNLDASKRLEISGSVEFRVGNVEAAEALGARASPLATARRSAGGDSGRGRVVLVNRDRGTSRDAAPPTPPGIRVRTGGSAD